MFMSWASSPRSLQNAFGLHRFSNIRVGDKHASDRVSLCAKLSYACGIATLASILWIWALLMHDIYKKSLGTLITLLYICLATVVSAILFILVLYVTLVLCRPQRRPSSGDANQIRSDHPQHHNHGDGDDHEAMTSPV